MSLLAGACLAAASCSDSDKEIKAPSPNFPEAVSPTIGAGVLADQSDVLLDENGDGHVGQRDAEEWEERESRNQLKHVAGLGELQDVTEVEYRKVRLERVVLVGVWSSMTTTAAQAEESLRELAALAETAGAVIVLSVTRISHPA